MIFNLYEQVQKGINRHPVLLLGHVHYCVREGSQDGGKDQAIR